MAMAADLRVYHRARGRLGDTDSESVIHFDDLEVCGGDDHSQSVVEHISLPQHLLKIPKKLVQIIIPWDRGNLEEFDADSGGPSGQQSLPRRAQRAGNRFRQVSFRKRNSVRQLGSDHDDNPKSLPGHIVNISKKIFLLSIPSRRDGRRIETSDTASETVEGDEVATREPSLPIRFLHMPIKVLQVIIRSPGGRREVEHEDSRRSEAYENIEMVYNPNPSTGRLRRIGRSVRQIVARKPNGRRDNLDSGSNIYNKVAILNNRDSIHFDPLTLSERVKRTSKRLSTIVTNNPKVVSREILTAATKGMEEHFKLAKELLVDNKNKIGLNKRRYVSRLRQRISSRFLKAEEPPRIIKKLEQDAFRAYYAYHKGLIPCLKTLTGENPGALKFVLNARKEDTKSDAWRLKDATSEFLSTANNYLECRAKLDAKYDEIDEFHRIANFNLSTDSGGIEADNSLNVNEFKAEYQQQSLAGRPVETLDELYEAAAKCLPVYERLVHDLVARVGHACNVDTSGMDVKIMPLKCRQRAINKSNDDYNIRTPGPAVSWLYDLVRGSIRFSTAEQVLSCLEIMTEDPTIHIVKAKNRFANPSLSGYRDLNIHIQIDIGEGFKHICELQIHHIEMFKLDLELESHKNYEFFRSYFAGEMVSLKDRLKDLEVIGKGDTVGDSFLFELLQKKNMGKERLSRLGALFDDYLHEYRWALLVYSRLWRERCQTHGLHHCEVANCYDKMANVLTRLGDTTNSLELYERSLDIKKRRNGEESEAVANSYNNMASVYQNQGNFEKAMELHKKSLEINQKTFGEEHLTIARNYNNMAITLKSQGLFIEALVLYRQSLEMEKSILGEEHPAVAETYHNLANVLGAEGELEEAVDLYQRSVRIKTRYLGRDHPSIRQTSMNMIQLFLSLAASLQEEGNFDDAIEMYKRCLDIDALYLGWERSVANLAFEKLHGARRARNTMRGKIVALWVGSIVVSKYLFLDKGFSEHSLVRFTQFFALGSLFYSLLFSKIVPALLWKCRQDLVTG